MKHFFCKAAVWGMLLILMPQQAEADIVVTVDVTGKTHGKAVVVYQTTIVEIPLDEAGHGTHTFRNISTMYADLYYGMDKHPFFMEDGDSLRFAFEGASFKERITCEAAGGKERIFDYLNRVTLTGLPEADYALPYADYTARLDKKEAAAHKLLKAWKLDEVDPRFVRVETGRIAYAYAAGRLMYAVAHPVVAQKEGYTPDEAYYDDLKKKFVENEDWVDLRNYREYMKEMANILGCKGAGRQTPYERTVCEMEYLADHLQNDRVRQALLNMLAVEQVEQYGIKDIDELLNLYNTYVTDTVLQNVFRGVCDAWDVTQPGKPSPDFRALDREGKSHTLAEFKGKYLYIDLWATWCGPCRREIPFLKKLEEDYRGRNITFLSLSTDARRADWSKVVEAQQMTGVQLFLGTGSRFQTAYKADGIPHFILLDPEGRIVNANMLRPSSDDVRPYLDALPGL